jgi:hypothetical protein
MKMAGVKAWIMMTSSDSAHSLALDVRPRYRDGRGCSSQVRIDRERSSKVVVWLH